MVIHLKGLVPKKFKNPWSLRNPLSRPPTTLPTYASNFAKHFIYIAAFIRRRITRFTSKRELHIKLLVSSQLHHHETTNCVWSLKKLQQLRQLLLFLFRNSNPKLRDVIQTLNKHTFFKNCIFITRHNRQKK